MSVLHRLKELDSTEGLDFLELLAHNLTIQVRIASSCTAPHGQHTEKQTRNSMYWINESLHNVVQMTRELRLGHTKWEPNEVFSWVQLWLDSKHGSEYVATAVDMSFNDLANN